MPAGLWRGTVTRTDTAGVFVKVPRLNRKHTYGPCALVESVGTITVATTVAGDPAHAHNVGAPVEVGTRVLVGFVEDRDDAPVILGRLR